MPDITMCKSIFCPLKTKCYRYTATPSEYWQSYFMDSPYSEEKEECKYFWDNNLNKYNDD